MVFIQDRRDAGLQMMNSALAQIQQRAADEQQARRLYLSTLMQGQPFERRAALLQANRGNGVNIPPEAMQKTQAEQFADLVAQQNMGIQQGFNPDDFQRNIIATENLTGRNPNAEYTNLTAQRAYLPPDQFNAAQQVAAKITPDADAIYAQTGPVGQSTAYENTEKGNQAAADAAFTKGPKTRLTGAQTNEAVAGTGLKSAETSKVRAETKKLTDSAAGGAGISFGTPEYRVAQNLAYGSLTFPQFRTLFAYSRDAQKKLAIYDKAAELNPNFDSAAFELGHSVAASPKVRQQVAAADNALARLDDAVRLSNAASRTGVKMLNGVVVPGGIEMGGVKYTNFAVAQKALADEISGALGFGTASDMKLKLGVELTDPTYSPEQFAGAIEQIRPFLTSKRASLVNQMGIYGKDINSFSGGQLSAPVGNAADPLGILH